jgi:hypothetical protein
MRRPVPEGVGRRIRLYGASIRGLDLPRPIFG